MTLHDARPKTEAKSSANEERAERILLATDGEAAAIAAAHWIAERALLKPLEVTVVHLAGDLRGAGPLDEKTTRAERVVWQEREYLAELAPDLVLRTAVLKGSKELALLAEAGEADLLVLGSNRAPGHPPLPVPSFSTRIGAAAPVPTIVVPLRWRPIRGKVVVGVDEALDDIEAIEFGAREAALHGTELVLEHARRSAVHQGDDELFVSEDEEWFLAARARLARLAGEAERRHPGLQVRAAVRTGPAAQVLEQAASDAALLVLAAHRLTPESHGLLGPAGRGVLLTPPCPVAIVPVRVP